MGIIGRKYGAWGSNRENRIEDLDKQLSAQSSSGSASSTADIAARQANETVRERTSRQAVVAGRNVRQGRSGGQGVGGTSQFPEAQSVQVVGQTETVLRRVAGREAFFKRRSEDDFQNNRGQWDRIQNVIKEREARSGSANLTRQGSNGFVGTAVANSATVVQPNTFKVFPNDRFRNLVQSGEDFIPDNVLDGYIDIQYHAVLSMVPSKSLTEIQTFLPLSAKKGGRAGGLDTLERRTKTEGSIVVASTGDVFRNETVDVVPIEETLATEEADSPGEFFTATPVEEDISIRNYYNIKDFEIVNNMSPDEHNPFQSDLIQAKMTLVEPHGLQLPEDIRLLSDIVGYEQINTGRVVYRLDIFFSGYNQNTGEWVPRINFDDKLTGFVTNVISYYFNISHIEAKVEHTGTTYALTLIPYGGIAWRPEEAMIDASAIFTSEEMKFGDFLKELEKAMETQKDQRTHGIIKRKYRFYAPEELLNATFYTSQDGFEGKQGLIGEGSEQGSTVSTGPMDIMTVLESALKDMPITWNSFLTDDKDVSGLEPRIHWVIKYNVIYGNNARANGQIQDLDSMTIEYVIEPFVTYKKATITDKDSAKLVTSVSAQVNRIQNMAEFGMINRIYNYINTETNTEVIDLNIDLQAFYFQQLNRQLDSGSLSGDMVQASAANVSTRREEIKKEKAKGLADVLGDAAARVFGQTVAAAVTLPLGGLGGTIVSSIQAVAKITAATKTISSQVPETPTTGKPAIVNPVSPNDSTNIENRARIESTLEKVLGRNIDNPDPFCNFIGNTPDVFTILGGGFNDTPESTPFGSTVGVAAERRNVYQVNLDDHLENDLLHLDSLVVRGDPIWLLSPYSTESISTATTSPDDVGSGNTEERRGIVGTRTARVIFLRMFAPRQDDLMNPSRQSASTSCSIIGGFYEVLNVTSTFEGGKFTQTIEAAKIHHTNFVEGFITFGPDNSTKTKTETSIAAELRNERVNEAVLKGQRGLDELRNRPVVLIGDPAPRRPTSEDDS